MTVRATPSDPTSRPKLARASKSEGTGATRLPAGSSTPAAAGTRRDAVQISAQARELKELGATRARAGELAPERLREVLKRLSQGHYDQPGVQAEVVRRLAKDL